MGSSSQAEHSSRGFNRSKKAKEKAKIAAKDYRERAKQRMRCNENTILYRRLLRKFVRLELSVFYSDPIETVFEEDDLSKLLFPL